MYWLQTDYELNQIKDLHVYSFSLHFYPKLLEIIKALPAL